MGKTKRKLNELVENTEKVVIKIAKSRIEAAAAELEAEAGKNGNNIQNNESVGSYVERTTDVLDPKTPEEVYIYWLGKNHIVDTSKTELFCKPVKDKLQKFEYTFNNEYTDIPKFNDLEYESPKNILNSLNVVEFFKATNFLQRRLKKIYFHILNMHAYSKRNFSKDMVNFYSESDFIQKFWSPMFEAFFTESQFVTHWGDTKSWSCKRENVDVKLDFRLVLGPSGVQYDSSTGEFAKLPTPKKLYEDRLKSIIVAKATINNILNNSDLTIVELNHLKVPIIQVMGFECQIFLVSLVEPKLYTVEKVFEMNFPVTHRDLRNGGIGSIIQGLSFIEEISLNIKDIVDEINMFKVPCKMDSISSGKKNPTVSKTEWITKVKWFSDEDFGTEE